MNVKYYLISVEHKMPSNCNKQAFYIVKYSNGIKEIKHVFDSSSVENINIPTIIEECIE